MKSKLSIGDDINFNNNVDKKLALSFCPDDILKTWDKAGSLANFITNYYKFNSDFDSNKIIVSSVINELIENAVKFSKTKSSSINIDTLKNNDKLLIKVTNEISNSRWETFIKTCNTLFSSNLKNLFLNRIEKLQNKKSSQGIGLILLKKDFNTNINFIFSKHYNNNLYVSVIAEVDFF